MNLKRSKIIMENLDIFYYDCECLLHLHSLSNEGVYANRVALCIMCGRYAMDPNLNVALWGPLNPSAMSTML